MKQWVDDFCGGFSNLLTLWLAGVAALYIVAGYCLAGLYDWPVNLHTQLYSNTMRWGTLWFVLGLVAWRSFYIMIAVRPERLTRTILADLGQNYFSARQLGRGIPLIIIFVFIYSVFTSFKSMIPEIVPFRYDEIFSNIDRAVHFGVDPWRILFPLLGNSTATTIISFCYKMWFVAMFCVLYWQAFSIKNDFLRARFFLTYVLCWILIGTVLATVLSSAGPCFYGYVVDGANPYEPLMTFLHESNKTSPVWDLFAQDYLWRMYKDETITFFSGISAMPSMHVSQAFLFMLVGWGSGRVTGLFFTAFFIVTMIGSVHLGWHYAIDGYVGMISTLIIWLSVGKVLKWVDARATARQMVESPAQA